jgi:hypothetical protein
MGIYWTSYLYFGRMMSKEAHERLVAAADSDKLARFVKPLTPGRWLLHAPTRCIHVGGIDPILEKHEVAAGHVEWKEVAEQLERNPDMKKQWEAATDDDLAELTKLVELASDPKTGPHKPGVYICEIEWTSYDMEDSGRVTNNIRVT